MPERKLQKKIIVWITGVILMIALCIIVVLQTVLHDALRKRLEKEGIIIARHVAEASINPVLTEQFFEIDMMVRDLKNREEGIVYIYVTNSEGRILAHTFDRGFPIDLKKIGEVDTTKEYSVNHITTEAGDVIDIDVPMLHGSAGAVHLGISEEYIKKDINSVIGIISMLMLGVLLIAYILSVVLSRKMARPIVELARVARAVGDGDLSQQVKVYSEDEIGDLSMVFNDMIQKRKKAESEREILISDLQKALHEVKTLSGLLPMCAWCKKIRNDEGYWTDVSTYISERTNADFSHGICPDCYKKVKAEEMDLQ